MDIGMVDEISKEGGEEDRVEKRKTTNMMIVNILTTTVRPKIKEKVVVGHKEEIKMECLLKTTQLTQTRRVIIKNLTMAEVKEVQKNKAKGVNNLARV